MLAVADTELIKLMTFYLTKIEFANGLLYLNIKHDLIFQVAIYIIRQRSTFVPPTNFYTLQLRLSAYFKYYALTHD